MRAFDATGLDFCHRQADFFASSPARSSLSSSLFIKTFMCSDFAVRVDRLEVVDFQVFYSKLSVQKSNKNPLRFSPDELYWIGYLYRYWCYVEGLSSRQIYHRIPPSRLRPLYLPYHTQDPAKAIAIIKESDPAFAQNDFDIVKAIFKSKK